ncbi:hypothetical protein OHB41_49660 [Streptomyces sp. NBC_01571]|uniref:hypothetical protein n=1 Tax=Streptomyces sp. NBC_01571 TaxID=2975883 RepID=UPI00225B27B4|nr:hypothetical protein [Streptomyces sp. NBC_01571]MCX4581030.1 hypothetical protein [Streptomyces sp. NBC_01571]
MELSVLLQHRDFLRRTPLQELRFPRYFRLTKKSFPFVTVSGSFQTEFQPVTESIGERTRLNILAVPVLILTVFRFWFCNSVGSQH